MIRRAWYWLPAFAIAALALIGFGPLVATSPAQEPVVDPQVHTIPFEHAGGVSGSVMVIDAKVDGKFTRLLWDTGAAFPLVIDREVAEQRGITGHYSVPVHGVGESKIHMTAVKSLAIGQWRTGALTAGIMDIGHIRKAMGMLGTRIDGIVGMPVISGFALVRHDFGKRRFVLTEFEPGVTLPAELIAVRKEFGRDLEAVRAIRAKTAGGLGVSVAVESDGGGLRVTRVRRGSVAAKAGLAAGDRLTEIAETPLGASPRDLRITEALTGAGHYVTLQFTRDGEARSLRVKLGAWKTGTPLTTEPEAEDF